MKHPPRSAWRLSPESRGRSAWLASTLRVLGSGTLLVAALAATACSPLDGPACGDQPWGYVSGTIAGPSFGGPPIRPGALALELRPAQASECVTTLEAISSGSGEFTFARVPAGVSFGLHIALPDSLRVPAQDSARQISVGDGQILSVAVQLEFAPRETILTFYVGDHDVPCMSWFPTRCLLVRDNPTDPWQSFLGGIRGFTWEPGFEYLLKVARYRAPQVPADGPFFEYRLVQQVSKTAAQ